MLLLRLALARAQARSKSLAIQQGSRRGAADLLILVASVLIAIGLQGSTRSTPASSSGEPSAMQETHEEHDGWHPCRSKDDDHYDDAARHDQHHRREPRLRLCIDRSLVAQQSQLPGINRGPARHGTIVVDPQGRKDQFVSDEVVYKAASKADLQAFVARYHGKVLWDGKPTIIPNNSRKATSGVSSGFYLIHVDVSRSGLADLQKNMTTRGLTGEFRFSSLAGAHLLALVGREANAGLNYINKPHQAKIPEHPNGIGGNLDASTFPWLNGSAPLQTNVIRAWDYLLYKGFPPDSGTWRPAIIAIADAGFALNPNDPTVRAPLNGNVDYGFFFQFDVVDHDGTAGSTEAGFHGQEVFSIAAAMPANSFGIAGTSGSVSTAILIRMDSSDYGMADAIRSATINGADVVNVSWGRQCGSVCQAFEPFNVQPVQDEIHFATGYGPTAVVISAGNDGISADNQFPCNVPDAICVGAVASNASAENFSDFGGAVTIWAPDCILATPNPNTASQPLGLAQLPIFCGTSAAAPFVSGIIGLIKQLEQPRVFGAGFTTAQIKGFLQSTATPSPDPKVSQGIVNALGAVMAASPNLPPTIQITSPAGGSQVIPNSSLQFISSVNDPEPGFPAHFFVDVQWTSNRDGLLCKGVACTPSHLSFGQHVITATVTDAFGASASASITINAIDYPPSASITYPPTNTTVHTSQQIELRGYATDAVDGLLPPSALTWSSNLDGGLGTGNKLFTRLSAGMHVVTLTARDSAGLAGTASVMVQVLPGADFPSVKIVSPADFSGFRSGGLVETLVGTATDPVDPTLPDSAFVWTDSVDGFLGTGKTLNVVLSNTFGVVIVHKITLSVTNSAGNAGTSQITLLVGEIS